MARYRLGRVRDDRSQPRVMLKAYPGATLTPPSSAGWQSSVPDGGWGMLRNDAIGDCVAAGALHAQQLLEKAARAVDTGFTDSDAVAMYSAIAGYDPKTGAHDDGATLKAGLDFWRKTGLGSGHYRIDAFAEFDHANVPLLKQLIADFGVAYLGLEVPDTAQNQFDAGQPWSVVKGTAIEGGHCVPAVGYDATYLYIVTWGRVHPVEWAFDARYFEESWVPVSHDWLEATGFTPSGLDAAGANAAYRTLTGTTDNPFPVTPAPVPTPVPPAPKPAPAPPPAPKPIPGPPDDATGFLRWLVALLTAWLRSHGR